MPKLTSTRGLADAGGRGLKAWLPIVIGALVASPAWGQRVTEAETGSHIAIPKRARIPDSVKVNDAEHARLVMADFARCTIDRRYNGVERAVSLPPGGAFHQAVTAIVTSECLENGQIQFKADAIRGPLFRELYVRRTAARERGRDFGPRISKIDLSMPVVGDKEKQHLAWMSFAGCVVDENPEGARRVVLSPVGNEAQDRAIADLTPTLGACLPQGTTLRLGKHVVEGALAEVLYRDVNRSAMVVQAAAESN